MTGIPYGERGYMIDTKGEITPINEMYGHEAFVKKYSKTTLSVINFVADKGWVLIQIIGNVVEITLCTETVTKSALSATNKVLSRYHRSDRISINDYDRENDLENYELHNGTYAQAVKQLVKYKSFAEISSVPINRG